MSNVIARVQNYREIGMAEWTLTNKYMISYSTGAQRQHYYGFQADSDDNAIEFGKNTYERITSKGYVGTDGNMNMQGLPRPDSHFPNFCVSRWIDYGPFSLRYWITVAYIGVHQIIRR